MRRCQWCRLASMPDNECRIAALSRADADRCLASRAPHKQDDIAEGTTNCETFSAVPRKGLGRLGKTPTNPRSWSFGKAENEHPLKIPSGVCGRCANA